MSDPLDGAKSSSSIDRLRSEGDLNFTDRRKEWSERWIGDETRRLIDEDSRYFLHQSLSTPCLNVLESAEGSWIIDAQGRHYLDFHGNNVHQIGFGHPRVKEAIRQQLDNLPFCTRRYTNATAVALAKRLTEKAPDDLSRVLFAPGGTSAMGMALKLARAATGRHKMIGLWDSFHGASLDMISVGGEAIFRSGIGPLLPGVEHAPPPDPSHCLWDCGKQCTAKCANYIEYILEKEGDVAAVVAETVRSTPFIPPAEYWQKVREACDRHGALLILDEIPHGLGRTGRFFTFEHFGIVPDMVVVGKGLGGGIMPLAALIAREGLNDAMKTKALGHYTHEKSPVACAAGLALLDVIDSENLLEEVRRKGDLAMELLRDLQARHAEIYDVRGLGLLMGVELCHNGDPKQRAFDLAERVMYRSLELGLNFKITMGNILTLTPPMTVSDDELRMAADILDKALAGD